VLTLSKRGQALATTPSCPITPSARAYKRRPPPLHLVRTNSSCPPVSCRTRPFPFSPLLIGATAARYLPFFSCRSQSTAVPQSCSPNPQSVAFDAGEPLCYRCPSELLLQCRCSSSVHFQGRHLAVDASREHLPTDRLAVDHLRMHCVAHSVCHRRATAGAAHAMRAVWAVTWAIHTLHYRPHWAKLRPIITGPRRPRALCMWADRAGFGPWMVF
jgi:hypothetical protein